MIPRALFVCTLCIVLLMLRLHVLNLRNVITDSSCSPVEQTSSGLVYSTQEFSIDISIGNYLFSRDALTLTRLNATAELLDHGAPLANESEACYGNKVRAVDPGRMKKLCIYDSDYQELFRRLPAEYRMGKFLICDGDCSVNPENALVVSKSRAVSAPSLRTVTILPLNLHRHQYLIPRGLEDPFTFHEKRAVAIWRGTTTNGCWSDHLRIDDKSTRCARRNLVARWASRNESGADVGITFLCQGALSHPSLYQPLLKDSLTVEQLLGYKYLISVEGNDVSSGLKWMLASNSVVLMPPPTRETFILEGRLLPWVHYVPLQYDLSDLLEKVQYCEQHTYLCEQIAKQGRDWMRRFQDRDALLDVGAKILLAHLETTQEAVVDGVRSLPVRFPVSPVPHWVTPKEYL